MSQELEAIQTEYNGYKFRSRLEARWAVFFHTLNLDFEYEREGYEIATGVWYLPDFYLDGLWMEVKHKDYDDDRAIQNMGLFVQGKREPGVIVYGEPYDHMAVLFIPIDEAPGYTRTVADFLNLENAIPAALIARQARFEHGEVPHV